MTGTVTVTAPFVSVGSVSHPTNDHFIITGQTVPNRTLSIYSSPDLLTTFSLLGTTTADANGLFQYDDAGATSLQMRFYKATYP